MSNALSFLTELKYIRREIPFGESVRSTKRSLYKIDDPFLNFWFTFIVPEKSSIEFGDGSRVLKEIRKKIPLYISAIWEELCRQSVPFILKGMDFNPASRWWGKGIDGTRMEIDVVAESADKKVLAIGEAKWTDNPDLEKEAANLLRKALILPFAKKQNIVPVLFVKKKPAASPDGVLVFGPDEVLEALA